MINEHRIHDLGNRVMVLEQAESEGEVSGYPLGAWSFVFRCLTEDEFNRLDVMNDTELNNFLFEDHSNDPLWEKFNDLLNFHEEWSYGELLVRMERMSDKNLADAVIWEWMLGRMPITKPDYEFFMSLTDEHMEAVCTGATPATSGDESIYPQIKAAHPGFDLDGLEERLGKVYSLWEAHALSHGDDWADHP